MNKYIVLNCPVLLPMTKLCDSENLNKPSTYCQDCTDCVIKQAIEKCKESPFKDCACGDDILQLFDIKEINK